MSALALHQLVSGFAMGDAISHEALALRDLCRHRGLASEIFAPPGRIAPDAVAECRELADYRPRAGEGVIYHCSVTSAATDAFRASPARKVLLYHNITPAEFYAPYDAAMVAQLTAARSALAQTARQADAVWADSAFNASELTALGVPRVKVFPLIFAPERFDVPADPVVRASFAHPMKTILFVGRVAPNKCVEELIQAFDWFNKGIEPRSRLVIVGSDRSTPGYFAMLRMLAGELDLPNVCFQRYASPGGLTACYEAADLFVTASRHEGFCLPLIEAMHKNVPVIARSVGGTPEAMGAAGVRYDELPPAEMAELWAALLTDEPLRRAVLDSQRQRVQEILARPVEKEFFALLAETADIKM